MERPPPPLPRPAPFALFWGGDFRFATNEAALAASIFNMVPTAYDPAHPMYTRKYRIDWNITLDTD